MTLTLIGQCPMSNLSELFPYTITCSSFKLIHPLFFELSSTQTDPHRWTVVVVISHNYNNSQNEFTEIEIHTYSMLI